MSKKNINIYDYSNQKIVSYKFNAYSIVWKEGKKTKYRENMNKNIIFIWLKIKYIKREKNKTEE